MLGHPSARGRHREVLQALARALLGRVEPADGLDLIAEELEPRREHLRRGPDIEDAAAAAELSRLEHERIPTVAGTVQGRNERLETDPPPPPAPVGGRAA